MELLYHGALVSSVLEHIGLRRLPAPLIKYFFCCPSMDYNLRCLPSSGGLYDQRMEDFIAFNIIENRIRSIQMREVRK